mmetsp:Transcript_7331/g.23887  ORF Transcript_7331/g.23887 Transcript_7331/m.23887 type:complete len:200 (-) Transcript_7331:370-969(-)
MLARQRANARRSAPPRDRRSSRSAPRRRLLSRSRFRSSSRRVESRHAANPVCMRPRAAFRKRLAATACACAARLALSTESRHTRMAPLCAARLRLRKAARSKAAPAALRAARCATRHVDRRRWSLAASLRSSCLLHMAESFAAALRFAVRTAPQACQQPAHLRQARVVRRSSRSMTRAAACCAPRSLSTSRRAARSAAT